jgi:hypothetical protein
MTERERSSRSSFFGSFPRRGVWTALGLTRMEFFVILLVSVALFSIVDGPIWQHPAGNHFRRITTSYLAIPLLILANQLTRKKFDLATLLGGSIVIGVIKLVLTALIVLAIPGRPA